jgi:hypothetical protein
MLKIEPRAMLPPGKPGATKLAALTMPRGKIVWAVAPVLSKTTAPETASPLKVM